MAKGGTEKTKQTVKGETPKPWQNRIVGTGTEAPDQLLANPRNWRIHPQAQQEGLDAVLDRVGWVQNVVVNRRTGFMVDGHLRVTLAMRREEPEVPVVYVDLSPEEEDMILASLDPIAMLARPDQTKLEELIGSVAEGDPMTAEILKRIAQDAKALPYETEDVQAHWQGMPEFEQEDQGAFRKVTVNFKTEEDVAAFFRLIGQNDTGKTRSIWYPQEARADLKALGYK